MSLKYGILGLLAERPLHGYEVKNRFESMLGGSWEVNFGQIYTTLQRLETLREGCPLSNNSCGVDTGARPHLNFLRPPQVGGGTWLNGPCV